MERWGGRGRWGVQGGREEGKGQMKREKEGVLRGGVVLKALNDDIRVPKHQKGANVTRTEVSGKVEGINTSNKFRLIGGSKGCSGGEASDFFSKMVYNSGGRSRRWRQGSALVGGGGRGGGGQPSQDSHKFPWPFEWQRGWKGGRDQPPI